MSVFRILVGVMLVVLEGQEASRAADSITYRFDFGTRARPPEPGFVAVTPEFPYDASVGYGVVATGPTRAEGFVFGVAVPPGNYRVSVTLGDAQTEATTTIKAESRRLMAASVRTAPGQFERRTFLVNVRTPRIGPKPGEPARNVNLKAREVGTADWDDRLTLEFLGQAKVAAVEVESVPTTEPILTVFLAGDSTVTDQTREPWASWGQMLPRFFGPGIVVANHAESGETLRSFVSEGRLAQIESRLRAGDYLFIQFGHNDQKERGEGVGAFTTYAASLRQYIQAARDHQAIPVLVTPVARRGFGPDGLVRDSLGDYPEAVRRVARELVVPLIDLNAMSHQFYQALAPEGSKRAFVDNTHHNNYGSFELARAVVEGIRQAVPDLASRLARDLTPFQPGHPDDPAAVAIPASLVRDLSVPDGS